MKTFSILVTTMLLSVSVFAQEVRKDKNEKEITVPEVVKKAFLAKFPNATKVEWGLEKAGEYEAEFKLGKTEMSANFDEKGTLIETESEIKMNELPEAIKNSISKEFPGYKVEEITKNEANGIVTYEMEAKIKLEIQMDNNGKILKKETIKKEQENEEKDKE